MTSLSGLKVALLGAGAAYLPTCSGTTLTGDGDKLFPEGEFDSSTPDEKMIADNLRNEAAAMAMRHGAAHQRQDVDTEAYELLIQDSGTELGLYIAERIAWRNFDGSAGLAILVHDDGYIQVEDVTSVDGTWFASSTLNRPFKPVEWDTKKDWTFCSTLDEAWAVIKKKSGRRLGVARLEEDLGSDDVAEAEQIVATASRNETVGVEHSHYLRHRSRPNEYSLVRRLNNMVDMTSIAYISSCDPGTQITGGAFGWGGHVVSDNSPSWNAVFNAGLLITKNHFRWGSIVGSMYVVTDPFATFNGQVECIEGCLWSSTTLRSVDSQVTQSGWNPMTVDFLAVGVSGQTHVVRADFNVYGTPSASPTGCPA